MASSSDDSSEDEDEARRRAELASCVVSSEDVALQGQSERKKRRPTASGSSGAANKAGLDGATTTDAAPAADDDAGDGPLDGTTHYLARSLMASLAKNLDPRLAEGVWCDGGATGTASQSKLRVFASSSTTQRHVPVDARLDASGPSAPVAAEATRVERHRDIRRFLSVLEVLDAKKAAASGRQVGAQSARIAELERQNLLLSQRVAELLAAEDPKDSTSKKGKGTEEAPDEERRRDKKEKKRKKREAVLAEAAGKEQTAQRKAEKKASKRERVAKEAE